MLNKLLEGLSQFWNNLYLSDFPTNLLVTLKIVASIFLASVLLYLFTYLLTYFTRAAKKLSKTLMLIFGILLFILIILILVNPKRACFFKNEEFFLSCQPTYSTEITPIVNNQKSQETTK